MLLGSQPLLFGSQPNQGESQDAFQDPFQDAGFPQQASQPRGQRSPAKFRSCSQPTQAQFTWPDPTGGSQQSDLQLG